MRSALIRIFLSLCLGACGEPFVSAQAAPFAPLRLTLADAIRCGLEATLAAISSAARVDESEGALARRTSAALLPRVNTQAYANYQNRNLRAFGISAPGLPPMVGPFSNYYVGFSAQQNLVDLAALRQRKAAAFTVDAARRDEDDVRDQIVRAVAAYYLNAQAAQARTAAAQARVNDAEALDKLARDRRDAGLATGVDVLRAQVQLANDRQALLADGNESRQALLLLARNIGFAPGVRLQLAEPLQFAPEPARSPEELITAALDARADLKSLSAQRESLSAQLGANRARFLPKLSVSGNYGGLGRNITGMSGTGLLQGQADFTLFDRDREGEARQLNAQLRRVDEQIADLRRGVEQEVRSAALDLESAAEQVVVAEEGRKLAHRELEQARDRFAEGVVNNIEVVTAQDEAARAEENYIVAVSRHADAKFALARAVGGSGQERAQGL